RTGAPDRTRGELFRRGRAHGGEGLLAEGHLRMSTTADSCASDHPPAETLGDAIRDLEVLLHQIQLLTALRSFVFAEFAGEMGPPKRLVVIDGRAPVRALPAALVQVDSLLAAAAAAAERRCGHLLGARFPGELVSAVIATEPARFVQQAGSADSSEILPE